MMRVVVHDGLVRSWRIAPDTPETRAREGIPAGL
jgi:hypothetical protein